ncbi:phage tail protein [Acinetobacter modestus]|uniref:phage tail protein n=1 Tax=Acinetobacter modestus TaxID=1776740 RepID=UPI00301A3A37
MTDINNLIEFAENGEKDITGLNQTNGFPAALKPARQWFNFLFNSLTSKINEVIAQVNTNKTNIENIDTEINGIASVLPGAIFLWCSSVVPTGYLELAGQAVSRTTYSALFALLGTTFGSGDGSTTFNLPDMRGEFVRGWDHGRGIDAGRTLGSAQAATSVFMGDPSVTAGRVANLYNNHDDDPQTLRTALNGEATTIDATNVSVLSSAAETPDPATPAQTTMSIRPRNIALMYIIKT